MIAAAIEKMRRVRMNKIGDEVSIIRGSICVYGQKVKVDLASLQSDASVTVHGNVQSDEIVRGYVQSNEIVRGYVTCETVWKNVDARESVQCGNVHGKVYDGGIVRCGNVQGSVHHK
ncbi:hypothetical protein [Paenibacillus piri]|uniref:Uncharacterized protein n=1 Tax=Paenibacillus piri TaxID=2547395 RepID=A0A4R5L0B0_9BACL|nr:hypothetical protein [Paenibacillus piri]TDG00918.1 hypothetical protein E1757_04715 [Paenibacillus piri]